MPKEEVDKLNHTKVYYTNNFQNRMPRLSWTLRTGQAVTVDETVTAQPPPKGTSAMAIEIIGEKRQRVNTRTSTDENFTQEVLTFAEESVLEIILNNTKRRGYCYAKNPALAEMSGKSIPTITRYVAKFCRMRLLVWRRVGKGRWLYPGPVDYPVIRQRLDTDEAQYTKETKEKYSYVSPNEILEEKTDKQEVQGANYHVSDNDNYGSRDTLRDSISRREPFPSDNKKITPAPTLPSESASEKANGRGDASETPGGLAEVDLLIEKSVEVMEGGRRDSQPSSMLNLSESPSNPMARPTDSIPRHGTSRIHAEINVTCFSQQDDTPAPTEATNVPSTLSEKERDNAHDGATEGLPQHRVAIPVQYHQPTGNPTEAVIRDRRRGETAGRDQEYSVCHDRDRVIDGGSIETLTAHGVDTAQAQRIASQHTQEAIARAIAYANQQEARKGRLTNKAGFIVSALSAGWHFKLLDVSPEGIKKRQERLRIRTEGATMVMGGVAPDMAYLRGRLGV